MMLRLGAEEYCSLIEFAVEARSKRSSHGVVSGLWVWQS
jgi:hypothetical protein